MVTWITSSEVWHIPIYRLLVQASQPAGQHLCTDKCYECTNTDLVWLKSWGTIAPPAPSLAMLLT